MSRRGGVANNSRVCNFFLEGRCKFGDNCKFEHPKSQAAYSSDRSGGPRNNVSSDRKQPDLPYNLNKEAIVADLKTERPQWPFSSYGPGRDAPKQLLEGAMEQSMEEMRVMYYQAEASGNPQPAIQAEVELYEKTNQQINQILGSIDDAVKYVLDGAKEHPNRRDGWQPPSSGRAGDASPFAKPAAGSTTMQSGNFGQPSPLGPSSAFGQPAQPVPTGAFGKPSMPGTGGAFGQPSQMGSGNAFGKPSMPGSGSAFGQPSQVGSTSAFGQPSQTGPTSTFGQPSRPSPFGQPAATASTLTFGQPSQPSPFTQPAAAASTSTFGQPSRPAGFGQPSSVGPTTSPFGQPSNNTGPSPFSQAQPNSTFGQPIGSQPSPFAQAATAPTTGGFGQPSPFGQPTQSNAVPTNPFGAKPVVSPAASNPFGQPSSQPAGQTAPSPFGAPSSTTPAPTSGFGAPNMNARASPFAPPPHTQTPQALPASTPGASATPDPSSYLDKGPNNTLRSFKGQQVQYIEGQPHYRRQDDRTLERIWFPDGPPTGPTQYVEESEEVYAAMGPALASLEEAYRLLGQNGAFQNGIPDVPPKRAWVRFDV